VTNRRAFICAAAAGALLLSRLPAAQPARKVVRIGWLTPDVLEAHSRVFREAMRALGHVEGQTFVVETRSADNDFDRLPGLAAELVKSKVDVIVAVSPPAIFAARKATETIPIVMAFWGGGGLIESGMVANLARPGGNVTGVNDPASVLSAKRLELLKELVPATRRVAVLWNAGDQAMTLRYREIEKAAQVLRVSIDPLGVREPDDFNAALAAMSRTRPDALMLVTDALTTLNRQRVLDYAAAQRIPAMYEFAAAVQAGGLMSYGSDTVESLKLAAEYVSKILKGAKPSDLPVEQPNRYYLVINLKTAKALGITIPQTLLLRADEVIE